MSTDSKLGGALRLISMLAVALMAVTGCQSSSSSSNSGSGAKTSLVFWIHGADPFINAHKAIIQQFEADNPNVSVTLQSFPFADFNTKVVSTIPTGSGPDLLEAYSPWMVGYIRTGLMDQVPASTLSASEFPSRYYESTLSLLKYKNAYYGTPSNLAAGSTRVLLVNDKVVSDSGVDVSGNKTFEDWITSWKALTKSSGGKITQEGLGQDCGQPADQFVSYLMEYGGSLYDSTGHKAGLNSAAGAKALGVLNDLTNTYQVNSTAITDFPCIPAGTAATGYRGTWVIPEYKKDYPALKYHYVLMPLPPGATQDVWQGGSGWATYVPKASKNKAAAWAFVKYIEAHRKTWIDDTGEIPADKALAKQEAAEKPELYGVYYPVLDQSKHGYPYGDYFAIYKILSDMYTSVALKQATVPAALATASTALDAHLSQWWSQYPG